MEDTLAQFRRFDLTGCGSMAREKLAGVLNECTDLSGEAIDVLIDSADIDGTGLIKYEQFVAWLFQQEEAAKADSLTCPCGEESCARRGNPRPACTACVGLPQACDASPRQASPHGSSSSCSHSPGRGAESSDPLAPGAVGVLGPPGWASKPGCAEEGGLTSCSTRPDCPAAGEPALAATGSTALPELDRSVLSASGAGDSVRGSAVGAPGEGAQICRYCLDVGDAEDLVSPCACRGSSSSVHVQCLLDYARQQQQEQQGIDVTCPTCKTPYMGTAALRLLPLALEDVKRRYGAQHVAVARVLKTMAGNHLSLMQFAEAKRCIEAAAQMHQDLRDAPFDVAGEPIDTAEVLAIRIMIDQGMCAVLQDVRWDAEAAACTVAQVVGILDEHYRHECGPDAPRVAGVLMSLCLGDSERPVRERIRMLQRALGLLESYYGQEHADEYANTLNVLTTMAILAGEVGDFRTVKGLSERAIVVQRRHSGPAHPTTLMSCCLLVCAQLKLGEVEEARVLLDQVIGVAEQTEFMPALAPAMRVVRARLRGELGDVAEMRSECLRIVEEANERCDLYTKLKGPEPGCTLREAEAVLGRLRGTSALFPEPQERSPDSPGSDWEDQLRDLAVRVALGDGERATALARASARELQGALGVDALRVMSSSIAYVRRFWARNLAGAQRAHLEAWFDGLIEHAASLSFARRLCVRAAAAEIVPLAARRRMAAASCGGDEHVDYGATRADAFLAGDRIQSLINMASLPGWALHEGDEGAIEAPGPLHGCASVRFGREALVLPLTDVCRPCDFEQRMKWREEPCRGLAKGQKVRSLVSANCHPRALARGSEGVITAIDRTRGRVNIDFGGEELLRVTLLLSDVCPLEEFELRLESRRAAMGGFFSGDIVRSLIHLPLGASRALRFGTEGVVSTLDVQHRRMLVRFAGDDSLQVLLRFQDVCLLEDFGAKVRERMMVLAGLMPGDRVRSLVACHDWVPRPLRVGDEGVILMVNPGTQRALVDFAGEEAVRGEMDPSSLCPLEDFEARLPEARARASGAGSEP
mmetsp:Transcript_8922/g.27690  ORF Transcript_8922/g.27690 Transcript_8922/m.27690 type:complete len:1043 (+) Transcript_8922:71-3199(+)